MTLRMDPTSGNARFRQQALSQDGGNTWTVTNRTDLVDPMCVWLRCVWGRMSAVSRLAWASQMRVRERSLFVGLQMRGLHDTSYHGWNAVFVERF